MQALVDNCIRECIDKMASWITQDMKQYCFAGMNNGCWFIPELQYFIMASGKNN
jgi:hypothetical protein